MNLKIKDIINLHRVKNFNHSFNKYGITELKNIITDISNSGSRNSKKKYYFSGLDNLQNSVFGIFIVYRDEIFSFKSFILRNSKVDWNLSSVLIPKLGARYIIRSLNQSRNNIIIDRLSCFNLCFVQEMEKKERGNKFIVYKNQTSETLVSTLNTNFNYLENHSKKNNFNLAIITGGNDLDILKIIDRLEPDSKCFIIYPAMKELINIDLYKYLHKKRIELVGVSELHLDNLYEDLDEKIHELY